MLHALKQLYKLTNCVIKFQGVSSKIFSMCSDKVQRHQFYFTMHSWTTCLSTFAVVIAL